MATYLLPCSYLENSMDRGAWQAKVLGKKCQTQLSDWHFHFPGGSVVKNLAAVQETWVWYLGREDPLEEEMATHSRILAMENPMDRGAWWAQSRGWKEYLTVWLSWRTHVTDQQGRSCVNTLDHLSFFLPSLLSFFSSSLFRDSLQHDYRASCISG